MRRLAVTFFVLLGTLATHCAIDAEKVAAEPLVVELWPGKTSGDVGIKGEEHSLIYQSEILGGPTKLITNVTKPTITTTTSACGRTIGSPQVGRTSARGGYKAKSC